MVKEFCCSTCGKWKKEDQKSPKKNGNRFVCLTCYHNKGKESNAKSKKNLTKLLREDIDSYMKKIWIYGRK